MLRTVHEAETENLKPVSPAHKFQVTLETDDFTDEKFQLYKDYQTSVHNDKPSEVSASGFKRFLCSSPLGRRTGSKDGKEQKLGSFHQCYRLDGKLIAIGVLDLLPRAVSGVYFIYHHDFEKWSFGKLSAMREAALAIEGGHEFYYMGYYIHNCVKMRYKGDYKPQYVLDPETYEWNVLDAGLRSLLDQKAYVSPSREGRIAAKTSGDVSEHLAGNNPAPKKESEGDDEPEYRLPNPKDAADANESLLSLGMPGIADATELEKQMDLGEVKILLRAGLLVETRVSIWFDPSV